LQPPAAWLFAAARPAAGRPETRMAWEHWAGRLRTAPCGLSSSVPHRRQWRAPHHGAPPRGTDAVLLDGAGGRPTGGGARRGTRQGEAAATGVPPRGGFGQTPPPGATPVATLLVRRGGGDVRRRDSMTLVCRPRGGCPRRPHLGRGPDADLGSWRPAQAGAPRDTGADVTRFERSLGDPPGRSTLSGGRVLGVRLRRPRGGCPRRPHLGRGPDADLGSWRHAQAGAPRDTGADVTRFERSLGDPPGRSTSSGGRVLGVRLTLPAAVDPSGDAPRWACCRVSASDARRRLRRPREAAYASLADHATCGGPDQARRGPRWAPSSSVPRPVGVP